MSEKTLELSEETKRQTKRSHEEFRQGVYRYLRRDGGECPECGGSVEKAWDYCGWCGADLTNRGEAE